MTDIEWTEKAIDLLDGLEREHQQRIISKLEEAQDWTAHRLDKLAGYPYYKLRAGEYQAIIT